MHLLSYAVMLNKMKKVSIKIGPFPKWSRFYPTYLFQEHWEVFITFCSNPIHGRPKNFFPEVDKLGVWGRKSPIII